MSTATHATMEAALDYATRGWRVVLLHHPVAGGCGCSCDKPDCGASAGKHPRFSDWQTPNVIPTYTRADVGRLWAKFPKANVGVQLGATSRLVDFEYDSPTEEADYLDLFDGTPPVTCLFTSKRGKHPLYEWRADLPGGATVQYRDLKVKVGNNDLGTQSVFPPSLHASGVQYEWLVHPDDCPPQPIPGSVVEKLRKAAGGHGADGKPGPRDWGKILEGVPEGARNDAMAALIGKRLAGCSLGEQDLALEWAFVETVNQRNKPPLAEGELRRLFDSILQREKARRNGNSHSPGRGSECRVGEPDLVCLDSIEPKQIRWLWPNRIAMGKFTLLAGDPGLGKSLITLDIAARITKGHGWPDCPEDTTEAGTVVILTAEDGAADTLRPRFDAAGGDASRIHLLQAVRWYDTEKKEETSEQFSLDRDLATLRKAMDRTGCRLAIIDPVSAYLGNVNSHKNAEVRRVLGPLATLAEETGVAVLGVEHLNKSPAKAVYRIQGSIAFVAAARAVWAVCRDAQNPLRRLMVAVKNNLAPDDLGGLGYSIVAPDNIPVLAWEAGKVEMSADEAMTRCAGEPHGDARATEEAVVWLRTVLEDGPVDSKELKAAASRDGITWHTIRRAKETLKIESCRQGYGKGGRWAWTLPDGELPF